MEKELNKYIKDKHTQEECSGFIDGYNAANKSGNTFLNKFNVLICIMNLVLLIFLVYQKNELDKKRHDFENNQTIDKDEKIDVNVRTIEGASIDINLDVLYKNVELKDPTLQNSYKNFIVYTIHTTASKYTKKEILDKNSPFIETLSNTLEKNKKEFTILSIQIKNPIQEDTFAERANKALTESMKQQVIQNLNNPKTN